MKLNPRYYIVVKYNNYDTELDRKIEKIANRESAGSGFGFGQRDLSFDFYYKRPAVKVLRKLSRIKKYGLTATLNEYDKEYL